MILKIKRKYYGTQYCLNKSFKNIPTKDKLNVPQINNLFQNLNLLHNKNDSLKCKLNIDSLEIWTCENVQFKDPIALLIQIVSFT